MDTKQLAQINQLKANQSQARAANSTRHCERGFSNLAKALEAPTLKTQKPYLLAACDAFAEGIKFQRVNPEAYIGFAFVLVAINNPAKALGYVKEAQRLQPDHPDVAPLLEAIQNKISQKAAQPSRSDAITRDGSLEGLNLAGSAALGLPAQAQTALASNDVDLDELYDQTEIEIMTDIKLLMTQNLLNPAISIQPAAQLKLAQQLMELQGRKHYFDQQLKRIDQEIDTDELSLKLKPLEQAIRRYEKALDLSKELAGLSAEILAQDQLTQQILQEIRTSIEPADIPIVEENLEILLDQTDLFANRLDAYEAQGVQAQESIQAYNKLLKSVEELQDALEDLSTGAKA